MKPLPVPTDFEHAEFLTDLVVRELKDGRHELRRDLWFYSAEIAQASGGSGLLVVPKGTITNYASVPRGLWNVFPPDGPWKWAATLHDASSHGEIQTPYGGRVHLVKFMTDRLWREAMSVPPCNDVPRWKRWLMYRLVVLFGTGAYGGTPVVDPVVMPSDVDDDDPDPPRVA